MALLSRPRNNSQLSAPLASFAHCTVIDIYFHNLPVSCYDDENPRTAVCSGGLTLLWPVLVSLVLQPVLRYLNLVDQCHRKSRFPYHRLPPHFQLVLLLLPVSEVG